MQRILDFIVQHMGFLWRDGRFRIVASEVTTVNAGDAWLEVESDVLRMRFVSDRGQLFFDLQPSSEDRSADWFSIDLVRRLFLQRPEPSGVLDAGYAVFLSSHLNEIEVRFGSARWPETKKELKRLKLVRSKELFG
jgi:hypothetical protein